VVILGAVRALAWRSLAEHGQKRVAELIVDQTENLGENLLRADCLFFFSYPHTTSRMAEKRKWGKVVRAVDSDYERMRLCRCGECPNFAAYQIELIYLCNPDIDWMGEWMDRILTCEEHAALPADALYRIAGESRPSSLDQ
jgi:hypothetical protein